jgi:preprotein translocase subunit SecD
MTRLLRYFPFALAVVASPVAAQPVVLDVARATVEYVQRTGEPLVIVRLTEAAGKRFGDFTQQNINKKVEFRVNGRMVTDPFIRSSIIGGSLQIPAASEADAREIARQLSSGGRLEVETAANQKP